MKKRTAEITANTTAGVLANTLYTARGALHFQGPLTYQEINQLHMDEGLDKFRNPREQKETLAYISTLPEGRVFVARSGRTITGYLTFHLPEFPRWNQCGLKEVIELGGMEVSRSCRGMGIALGLLQYAFSSHDFEDYIVISMETYCNWDLRGSGLNLWEYRNMLENLLSKVGLERRLTDDPEVTDHPANMLTVRVGGNVSPETLAEFEKLLFLKRNSN